MALLSLERLTVQPAKTLNLATALYIEKIMDGKNYWTQLTAAAHFAIVLMSKDKNITNC